MENHIGPELTAPYQGPAGPAGHAATGASPHPAVGPLAAEEQGLLACVHCGFCLNACPTYTRLGDEADSPRGRLDLMRAAVEGRIRPDDPAFQLHIDRCLGCRACEPVCPSGVPYGFLLERARTAIARSAGVSMSTRLLIASFTGPARGPVTALSRIMRGSGLARLLARVLPRVTALPRFGMAMLAGSAPWRGLAGPQIRRRTGRAAGARRGEPGPASRARAFPADHARAELAAPVRPEPAPRTRVALLDGCVQEAIFARVNRATERVLEANGCELVAAPAQRCCGALDAHAGRLERALELARANIAAFEASGADVYVVNAAGCGAMMKEYAEQLHRDPEWSERAAAFSARVRDVSEFLAERGVRQGAPVPVRVTYDAPCHLLHAQRIRDAPLALLDAVPGLERIPLPRADECCGGAGLYGVNHPELGGRILDDKVGAIRSTGAEAVCTPNPGCMMQIGAGLVLDGSDVGVLHPIELLDESYRRQREAE